MATTTTNYGWDIPQSSDLVKDGATAIATLGQDADTTVWNNAQAAINKTLVDAKGDLIVASAADTVARLAVGSNGQVLTANSSATNGVEWATASSGTTWTLLNSGGTSLTSTATTVSGISGKDKLFIIIKDASGSNINTSFLLRFNSDSGNNYNNYGIANYAYASWGDVPFREFNQTATDSISIGYSGSVSTRLLTGYVNVSGCNSSGVKIYDLATSMNTGGANSDQSQRNFGGFYNSSSSISSVTLSVSSGSFDDGTIYVYGA